MADERYDISITKEYLIRNKAKLLYLLLLPTAATGLAHLIRTIVLSFFMFLKALDSFR